MDQHTDHLLKVVVIGHGRVGKTSIVQRYVKKTFTENYKMTIGVDFVLKTIQWDARTVVRLQFWDIAGQEQTRIVSRVFYKEARGALVVFDASDWTTLDSAAQWKRDLDSRVIGDTGKPIPAILLANKCDLVQPRDREQMAPSLDKFCKDHRFAGWFETSAKEDLNIEEATSFLVEQMMSHGSVFEQDKDVVKPALKTSQSISALCC